MIAKFIIPINRTIKNSHTQHQKKLIASPQKANFRFKNFSSNKICRKIENGRRSSPQLKYTIGRKLKGLETKEFRRSFRILIANFQNPI